MQKRRKYQVHNKAYRYKEGLIERNVYKRVLLRLLYEPENHKVEWTHVLWLKEHWNWKLRGDIWVYKTDKGYMVLGGNHRTWAMKLKRVKRVRVRCLKPSTFIQYTDLVSKKEEIMEVTQFMSRFFDYHKDYGTDEVWPIRRSTP